MGVLKNLRNVLPLPRNWKDEEHHFGLRVNDAITELFANDGKLNKRDDETDLKIEDLANDVSALEDDVAELEASKLNKSTAQNTFPNLTVASIDPDGSPLMPQGADLDDYDIPGTYICVSGTYAATMSNVPPGVSTNFKLIVNRNTESSSGWWGCQIVLANEHIHIRSHADQSYSKWQRISWTINTDTWSDFLAKAKDNQDIAFTFFANDTITNTLCGISVKSYGTCMYSNGYLLWNLCTYNDHAYYGWYKDADNTKKVYIVNKQNNTGVIEYYTKTGVSIPNNASFTVDLSSNIPPGYALWDANVQVLYGGTTYYHLPYISNAMDKGMWITQILNNTISIRCSDSGWGTCDLYITAFLRHT